MASTSVPRKRVAAIPDSVEIERGEIVLAQGDCFKSGCISRRILTHVTGRWGVLLVTALGERSPLRFSELRARIEGISEKILSQKLREFEADGLITRRDHGVVPPHVDYSLTKLGRGVARHLEELTTWIEAKAAEFLRLCPSMNDDAELKQKISK